MLKNKSKLLLIIVMIMTFALSPLSFADNETPEDTAESSNATETQEVQQQENQEVQKQATEQELISQQEQAKSGDQYLMGDKVTVDYVVDGNLYVMADEVTIKSQIIGNAFVMANKITLTDEGYVGASTFALGNDVEINGVTFDAYVVADNLTVSGYVYRDIHAVSERFYLYGAVGRDASIGAENFNFKKSDEDEKTGKIMGNFDYSAKTEIQIPEDVVSGNVKYSQIEEFNYKPNYVFLGISSVIFVLIIWGLLKWLAPKFEEKTEKLVTDKPLKTVGFGLLALIVIPILAIILMITGFAASAGLLLLTTYLILICVSRSISVIAINNIIAKKIKFDTTTKKLLLFIITSLVVWAVTLIPYVWLLVNLVLVICGFGIIFRNLLENNKNN